MRVSFRDARAGDLKAVVGLLQDDVLGAKREAADLAPYQDAFRAMATEPQNTLIVGEEDGEIIATYQLVFLSSLSHQGTRRAEVEAVRVARARRGQGIGRALMADAEQRARAAGCGMLQLATNNSRDGAQRFYSKLGFSPSHVGMKKRLD